MEMRLVARDSLVEIPFEVGEGDYNRAAARFVA
jgi:hypothetical protein